MAYPTFTPPVTAGISPGTSSEEEPRIREAGFGDGYRQTSGDGINTLLEKAEVKFDDLTWAEAATIRNFFRAQRGYLPFYFKMPDDTVTRLWQAKKWSRTITNRKVISITATFEEWVGA